MAKWQQTALVGGKRANGKLTRAGYGLRLENSKEAIHLWTCTAPDGTVLAEHVDYHKAIEVGRTHQNRTALETQLA